MKSSDQKLLNSARKARKKALSKLSGYKVGAAILAGSGKVYAAANIESDIPALSLCADRLALFTALSAGEKKFESIAVVTETRRATPCGSCRQVLFEFCGPDLKVITATLGRKAKHFSLSDLLPHPYKKERG